MDLVTMYQEGKIKGTISEAQSLAIWEQIKKDIPFLMDTLNSVDQKKQISEDDTISFKEKIDLYPKLVNRICKQFLRKEVPFFDDELSFHIKSISKNENFGNYEVITNLLREYVLIEGSKSIFRTKGSSLFHILARLLNKKNSDEKLFAYYLGILDNKETVDLIKKAWVIHLYFLSKNNI